MFSRDSRLFCSCELPFSKEEASTKRQRNGSGSLSYISRRAFVCLKVARILCPCERLAKMARTMVYVFPVPVHSWNLVSDNLGSTLLKDAAYQEDLQLGQLGNLHIKALSKSSLDFWTLAEARLYQGLSHQ